MVVCLCVSASHLRLPSLPHPEDPYQRQLWSKDLHTVEDWMLDCYRLQCHLQADLCKVIFFFLDDLIEVGTCVIVRMKKRWKTGSHSALDELKVWKLHI